ncbi:MAG: winged helix-turn-helix transcriptional regulator [Nanoarchaeota archaeon]|nr:winged helix-turn-helix transcriptional regulator [Nanoarchaeota archaeon]
MKTSKYVDFKGFLRFKILHLLKNKNLCGDELAEVIGSKKFGKLTPGTIYPVLKILRENKLISFKQCGRKKVYKLTKKGEKEYKKIKRIFKRIFKEVF